MILKRTQGPGREMSLKDSLHRVADPCHLNSSVEEVFQMMLGVSCQGLSEPAPAGRESVTAVIGFGGLLSGAYVFRCGSRDAMEIASRLTGTAITEVNDTVKDAIGEMGNMLAGAWKSRIPELAAHCGLSLPAVITGHDYELRVQAPEFELRHAYQFEGTHFDVTIVCDRIQ